MRTRNVLAAALSALCFSAAAKAEDMKADGLYVKADLGAAFVQDISQDLGVAGLGMTVGFDRGRMGAIGIGKYMSNSFRIEGEIGYMNADAGELTVSGAGGVRIPIDFSGELSTLSFTLAGYADLSDGPFRPYFGGGLGIARWETIVDTLAGVDLNEKEDGTDLTAFAEAGVAYHVSGNVAFTGSWRYQRVDTESHLDSHVVKAGIRYSF
ncbi:MAG: outer membrane beta-barrel protein [Rhodospirillales bacterium]|nr:outer membrane beta-barrel protein [Rhodospirillales bacterium]